MEFLSFDSEYKIAWGFYLIAALGCFWMWTFFTRWIWRYLREPLWVVMAGLLFTPVQMSGNSSELAPASIVVLLELVFKQHKDSWLALSNLSVVLAALFAVYLLFVLLRWLLLRSFRNSAPAAPENADSPGCDSAAKV